ncbi:glutamine synthetase III [Paludicola sp. MB14-C6]|uniref:glutamine synthetase III family protein n=1 Tax=Paludihabitans sp. MB14-C6 TaxID=3070656 RepID=UPI0027DC1A08|nr:glutamine synthetase III [Paludicola sp. MB14-C6]WMJ23882.1 glutamine synthetase III [Paludicola sp. MB14-C6]
MSFDFTSFGCQVFNDRVMKERLPANIYASLKQSIDEGQSLHPEIADEVANAMKTWAIEQGATHFTHWFQPMTNITAGKHDSFISPKKDGSVVLNFSGKELIKGEPDASSFPNGGIRNTFEARGYTAWDCTSPAFVRDGTLYIPTAFCSYTGEALDTKTPLLRSMAAISTEALRLIRLFGNHTSTRVSATVGAEQEYFLIDREMYESRLDLKICGRTLFGAKPPKGQEMDDHYFGRIRIRVAEFMRQLDEELWKLGITSKTKHNEVAPAQHELAPIFETVNIACDHNQLTMEMMRIIAKKNGLACLLHEKPFDLVNGSGKHNNWSLSTDDGINLLDPGKTPYENIQFLLVLAAIIKAVDEYADLLRMSAAVVGNDYRLGGHEAPPTIISIFLGEQLTSILEHIADDSNPISKSAEMLSIGVATLPKLKKDDSDRNRTSPFAFTGNKFEFRMVGSSASIACANYVLNTIVAKSFSEISSRLEACSDFDKEVKNIITEIMRDHGRVIFNGNNYTDEWVEIAAKRGLPNLPNTIEAAGALIDPKNINVLKEFNVLSEVECYSRHEIMIENYAKIITIEANTMLEMIHREILPSIIRFVGDTAQSYNQLKAANIDNDSIHNQLTLLSDKITDITKLTNELEQKLRKLHELSNSLSTKETAVLCRDDIKVVMQKLRTVVDSVEVIVSDEYWPMPNYTDLLHRV